MDESEKRRERLKAMRIEADGAVDDSSGLAASSGLSNPLAEFQNSSSAPTQSFSPRFDYYTDPMAAYSGNRRRDNNTRPTNPNPNPTMTPESSHQTPLIKSPDPRMFQNPGAHLNQRPIWRPMEMATPSQFNPPNVLGPPSVPPRPFNYPYPSNRPQSYSPNERFRPSQAYNYPAPPYMPRGGNFRHEGYGRGYNGNSHYDSGRGGRRYVDSGRGRGRSRGGGSHGSVSAEMRPDLYYKKEMVEDPWADLTPVVWKGSDAGETDESWLPKSITAKKAKVSSGVPQPSISQQSLAEYLASSFGDSNDGVVQKEASS